MSLAHAPSTIMATAKLQQSVDAAVGIHQFTPSQLATLHKLQRTVACCGKIHAVLAATDAIQGLLVLGLYCERITRVGVPFGQVASVLHDSSLAFLLLRVAACLQSMGGVSNHIPHLMQVTMCGCVAGDTGDYKNDCFIVQWPVQHPHHLVIMQLPV